MSTYPIEAIRADFPALQQRLGEYPLTYLDNAATTLKPLVVVETVRRHYLEESANVHRGVHYLSQKATEAFDGARGIVRGFLNAAHDEEIIFTSGTTGSINLVARSYAQPLLKAGDEILISHMEHHSNIVPWQMLREQTGCVLRVVPITDDGRIDQDAYAAMLGPRTRLVSLVYVSNSLGTVNPVGAMIRAAHACGAKVLIDAAQAAACRPLDVQALDCDFLALSGHKLFGPTGVGVLYGKRALLEAMPPYMGGGDMILSVTFEKTIYNALPYKFEAGTPHIAGVIGLGRALEYVQAIGLERIAAHEEDLRGYATERLQAISGVRLIGTAPEKVAIVSFTLDGVHPHDVGSILDGYGVAVRAGHHCTQPVMQRYGVPATTRASFSLYNTRDEVDRLAEGVCKVKELFA